MDFEVIGWLRKQKIQISVRNPSERLAQQFAPWSFSDVDIAGQGGCEKI
jgi:hypothetical protein